MNRHKEQELIQRIKERIAYHANEHPHTYVLGKGVMDCLARDILVDLRDVAEWEGDYL